MSKGKILGQGRTAEVYLWDNNKILKLFRDCVPADWSQYEAMIARTVFAAGVPAPELFEIIQDNGRAGLIYQRIDGISLLKLIITKPWSISKYARQMARLHFQIHQSSTDKLPSQNERMTQMIMRAEPILGEKTVKIIAYLSSLPDKHQVCHGDFHPDNILVSNKEWVTIDWMNAYAGNPLSDVARSCLMLKTPYLPPRTPHLLIIILKRTIYSAYIKEYIQLAHVQWEDIESWMLPVAAARLCEKIPGEEKWLLEMIDNKLNQIENLP